MSTQASDAPQFIWKGKAVETIGELLDAVASVATEDEAKAFMDAYGAVNEHSAANIGYVIGYLDQENRTRLYDLFNIVHPVYGRAV